MWFAVSLILALVLCGHVHFDRGIRDVEYINKLNFNVKQFYRVPTTHDIVRLLPNR